MQPQVIRVRFHVIRVRFLVFRTVAVYAQAVAVRGLSFHLLPPQQLLHRAGGSLSTSSRLTSNLLILLLRTLCASVCQSVHPGGASCSELSRMLALNEPPAVASSANMERSTRRMGGLGRGAMGRTSLTTHPRQTQGQGDNDACLVITARLKDPKYGESIRPCCFLGPFAPPHGPKCIGCQKAHEEGRIEEGRMEQGHMQWGCQKTPETRLSGKHRRSRR